ncbi:SH3 domain-containing protein [Vitreimonas flagellata]|uniref:SH3 domain-containing protein n=1 Tax=Vitreimonas flagellata TaxID=2560861 RepID=UPI001074EA17|nr:SH3 domain-containing protein [Vitreimonas flagellata]
MRRLIAVLLLIFVGLATPDIAGADEVTPSERVASVLRVREAPGADADIIAQLGPGERVELVGERPGWFQVRLPDGRTGFVSKGWAVVISTPPIAPISAPTEQRGDIVIHVVDVATGLAVIVRGPDFTLLYDGGSNDDLQRGEIEGPDGALVTGNRLWAYMRAVLPDLTRIDAVILSHPHRDHVELMDDIFAHYEIGEVFDSGRMNAICGYRRFIEAIEVEPDIVYHDAIGGPGRRRVSFPAGCREDARVYVLNRGDQVVSGQAWPLGAFASMTFLHADGADHPSENENSLVMRLDLGEGDDATRILFMGDAEAGARVNWPDETPEAGSVEAALLQSPEALASDILIVGHHGSRTSSRRDFLDAVGADLFVVSSGPKRYSGITLPDGIVIQELEERGAVWRTDITDSRCRREANKIGPDADNRAGGCDNIQIFVDEDGHYRAAYFRPAD